jgi:hypothetical protein
MKLAGHRSASTAMRYVGEAAELRRVPEAALPRLPAANVASEAAPPRLPAANETVGSEVATCAVPAPLNGVTEATTTGAMSGSPTTPGEDPDATDPGPCSGVQTSEGIAAEGPDLAVAIRGKSLVDPGGPSRSGGSIDRSEGPSFRDKTRFTTADRCTPEPKARGSKPRSRWDGFF